MHGSCGSPGAVVQRRPRAPFPEPGVLVGRFPLTSHCRGTRAPDTPGSQLVATQRESAHAALEFVSCNSQLGAAGTTTLSSGAVGSNQLATRVVV